MPPPEALTSGEHDPFFTDKSLDNRSHVVYGTNRLPIGLKEDRSYLTLFDKNLRLGVARVRIGGEEQSGETLHALSTSSEREEQIPLTLEKAEERALISTQEESPPLTPQAQAFFDSLNTALANSLDPDLTIYVHGANNNFYRASAQASQLRHFSGKNSVVMLYAWPSAESILRYAVDVNNAAKTVPVFARMLELLSRHTNARYIDILAYSAGAQVVSPALALLGKQNEGEDAGQLKERLRLGEIYFAAPDVNFKNFLEDMATYIDLPSHVTLAVNPDDSVLAFASHHHGISRAGRPDKTELTTEETQWVMDATRRLP
ncbi:MAG: alpha/beta hydrolase, partial [Gammaproteobacteria bacterium]|nr:alpha/beta hydrolase [Gammaproteobacteria bacterium]